MILLQGRGPRIDFRDSQVSHNIDKFIFLLYYSTLEVKFINIAKIDCDVAETLVESTAGQEHGLLANKIVG